MSSDPALPGEITALLQRWSEGDSKALASLASVAVSYTHLDVYKRQA